MPRKHRLATVIALLHCIVLCACTDQGLTLPGQRDVGDGNWIAVTAGRDFTCALTSVGAAYCWGDNANRLLGITTAEAEVPAPTAVRGGFTFKAISAGYDHVCALTLDGAAYCWGSSSFGKLGAAVGGLENIVDEPAPVTGGLTFISISAGFNHTCGVSQAGAAYCWGSDVGGALGVGGTAICTPGLHDDATANDFDQVCIRLAPTAVAGSEMFLSISAGNDYTCGVHVDGTAY